MFVVVDSCARVPHLLRRRRRRSAHWNRSEERDVVQTEEPKQHSNNNNNHHHRSEICDNDARCVSAKRESMPCSELALRDHMTPHNSIQHQRRFILERRKESVSATDFGCGGKRKSHDYSDYTLKISSGESDLTLERMEVGGGSSTSSSDNNGRVIEQQAATGFAERFMPESTSYYIAPDPEKPKKGSNSAAEDDWLALGLGSGLTRQSQKMKDLATTTRHSSSYDNRVSPAQAINAEYMRYQQPQQQMYNFTKMSPYLPPPAAPHFSPPNFQDMNPRGAFADKAGLSSFASMLNSLAAQEAHRRQMSIPQQQQQSERNWTAYRTVPAAETANSWGAIYGGVSEERMALAMQQQPHDTRRGMCEGFIADIRDHKLARAMPSHMPEMHSGSYSEVKAEMNSQCGSSRDCLKLAGHGQQLPHHDLPSSSAERFQKVPEATTTGPLAKWSEHTRIFTPSRSSETGVWFTLQALNDHENGDRVLPQIPRNYLRIKDGNTTILTVKKYLASKLGLCDESEVEISCRGQLLLSSLTLQHVRDVVWLSRFKDDNVPIKFINSYENVNNSFDLSNHMMVLHYTRSHSKEFVNACS